MNRREVCKTIAGVGLAGSARAGTSLPNSSGIASTPTDANETTAATAFASSFSHALDAYGPTEMRFKRALPAELTGTLYRNGPGVMRHGATAYQHWFDGDGLVQAWSMHGTQLTHAARTVRTARHDAERKARRLLWAGFGTDVSDTESVSSPDTINAGNISVLPFADELLALWEAGSAWSLDPKTLQTRSRKIFSPDTDGLSFSAHPRLEADGHIWNFGYLSGSGKIVLYELNRHGKLLRAGLVAAQHAEMVHDFVITERYLGFVLMPLAYDASMPPGVAFMNRLSWQDDQAVTVLLIDKHSWRIAHRFELPPFFAFHFGNAFEDGDTVRIPTAKAPPFDLLMQAIVNATTGKAVAALPAQRFSELVLNTRTGSAMVSELPLTDAEFPVHDPRFSGQRSKHLFVLGNSSNRPEGLFGFNTVIAFNRESGRSDQFDYGPNVIAEEHQFVPRYGGQEGEGWLIGSAFDWRRQRTMFSVFNAREPSAGPIAQAELPYGMPLGLHGRWHPGA